MAAKKYLAFLLGRRTEVAGVVVSAGAGNDGDLVALDAAGKLDASVLPAGVGVNTVSGTASEALSANDMVNIFAGGVRKADATTTGKEAHGFVKASVSSAATATIYLPGDVIAGLSGLTPGARQFLSTTAGLPTETAPAATGNVAQMIGIAASATSIMFEPEEPITRA